MGELNVEPLERALGQLRAGVARAQAQREDELLRDGVIQRFEYCVDLCWKLLQRYLRQVAQVEEAVLRTKKDLFREGARRGLLADAEAWIGYYEARNQTAHTYNPAAAAAVFEAAVRFAAEAGDLLRELRRC